MFLGLQGNFSSHGDLGTDSFICGVPFFRALQFGVKRVGQKGEREGVLLLHNAGLCPIGKKTSFSIWVWHVSCPHPFQVHVMYLNNWSQAGCSVLWGCGTIGRWVYTEGSGGFFVFAFLFFWGGEVYSLAPLPVLNFCFLVYWYMIKQFRTLLPWLWAGPTYIPSLLRWTASFNLEPWLWAALTPIPFLLWWTASFNLEPE